MKPRAFLPFLAGLLALIGSAALAQNTGLVRLTDRDDLLGWEAVGRLDIGGRGYCTGTLIAPDLVLTAAHCVTDPAAGIRAETLTFRAGLRDGVAVAERGVAQFAVAPGYVPGGPRGTAQILNDVALLRLDAPITVRDADPFVIHSGAVPGDAVSVTSYGQGRSEALSRQRQCRITGRSQGLMAFDCDVTFGSSGAPVLYRAQGRGRIVSIISGGGTVAGREVAFGMELPETVAALKRALRAAPTPPPATVRRLGAAARNGGLGAKFVRP